MDIRKSINRLFREYGHDVYLQRRRPDITMGPYDQVVFQERLERHTVRNMHPSSVGLARLAEEMPEGVVTNVDIVFWFAWDVNPSEGDRIYEPRPDIPQGYIIFTIDYSWPLRGRRGRIEYWACGCTKSSPN